MSKKVIKYLVGAVAIVLVLVNSLYFKKLDEVRAAEAKEEFDAQSFARDLWEGELIPNLDKAIEMNKLTYLLQTQPGPTFQKHSNALGIGNIRYFLVSGQGTVKSVNENDVVVKLTTDSTRQTVHIATEYIFGNAVRDASRLVDISQFKNTMHFNNVSAALNKIIRQEVVPPFRKEVAKGHSVAFVGAIELNKAHLNLGNIEVIPVSLTIQKTNTP